MSAMKADFTDCSMRGANLTGANLKDADLSGAQMEGAAVAGANLAGGASCTWRLPIGCSPRGTARGPPSTSRS